MVQQALSCLNQVASFLKVQPGKVNTDEDSVPVRTRNQTVQKGFINIIFEFLKESQAKTNLKTSSNPLEDAQIWQWLEYAIVYAVHTNSHQNIQQILSELNGVLQLKTYLVSHKLTIADVVLYYLLYNVMLSLTPVEKETYLNVSRWFDNLQQDECIRQSNKLVNVSSTYVACSVPSRHI